MVSKELVRFLGKGSFGSVDLIKFSNPDGSFLAKYAVKSCCDGDHKSLIKEFEILSKLRNCPRIVQTYGTSLSTEVDDKGISVYKMVMEFASRGSLTSFMESRRLRDSRIKDFTRMILEGLVSVHSLGYVHCDLKPDNLLVFSRLEYVKDFGWKAVYELKISDFGMATETGKDSEFWDFDSPYLGTPLYMSPESVHDGNAEEALDLWSLGCIVLEMYTGEQPWPFEDTEDLLPVLLNRDAPEIPEFVPWEARKFIEKCFKKNPVERGTASELLKHPFVEKVSDQKTVKVASGESAVVEKSKKITGKPLKVKIIPPKAVQFKKVSKKPLRVKIIPPKPPGFDVFRFSRV